MQTAESDACQNLPSWQIKLDLSMGGQLHHADACPLANAICLLCRLHSTVTRCALQHMTEPLHLLRRHLSPHPQKVSPLHLKDIHLDTVPE